MFRRKHSDIQPGPGVPPPPQEPGFPPSRPEPEPRRRRTAGRRHSIWLYAFALIGFLAVCFLLIRFLIVPLLVALA